MENGGIYCSLYSTKEEHTHSALDRQVDGLSLVLLFKKFLVKKITGGQETATGSFRF